MSRLRSPFDKGKSNQALDYEGTSRGGHGGNYEQPIKITTPYHRRQQLHVLLKNLHGSD